MYVVALETRALFTPHVACAMFDVQVDILVDDGNDDDGDVVEAGELGSVATRAEFYDQRLSDTVGCDPAGCSAALTRVGFAMFPSVPSFWKAVRHSAAAFARRGPVIG